MLKPQKTQVQNEGATALARQALNSTAVSTLRLHRCGITAEGCQALSQGACKSTNLTALDLSSNAIRDEGVTALSSVVSFAVPMYSSNCCCPSREEASLSIKQLYLFPLPLPLCASPFFPLPPLPPSSGALWLSPSRLLRPFAASVSLLFPPPSLSFFRTLPLNWQLPLGRLSTLNIASCEIGAEGCMVLARAIQKSCIHGACTSSKDAAAGAPSAAVATQVIHKYSLIVVSSIVPPVSIWAGSTWSCTRNRLVDFFDSIRRPTDAAAVVVQDTEYR